MLSSEEVERIRSDFPVFKKIIHMAAAGISPMPLCAIEAIEEGIRRIYHNWDWSWVEEVKKGCRETLARLINADPDEIALIRSTTEGINAVASGIAWREGENIVTDDLEYPANVLPWYHQAKRHGLEVRIVKSENGFLHTHAFQEKIDERTKVIAVSHVQFVNGFRLDLKELSKMAHEVGALLFVDAIQSIGAIKVDVKKLGIDAMSAGGYKWMCGPADTGLLYVSKKVLEEINPQYMGFESLEKEEEEELWGEVVTGLGYVRDYRKLSSTAKRFEYGSRSAPLVAGLKSAVDYLLKIGIDRIERRIEMLVDYLMKRLEEEGYNTITPIDKKHRAGIVNFRPGIDLKREEVVKRFDSKLKERGIVISIRGGGIRASCHFFNKVEDIDKLLETVKAIAKGV
jgi:selenocysteine lyase/cysteine desulfurase